MIFNKKIVVSILLIIFFNTSFAGSRGLYFVLYNLGSESFYESNAFNGFLDLSLDDSCWSNNIWNEVSRFTRKKIPQGLTKSKMEKIWSGDYSGIIEVRKILHLKDEFSRSEGYDGLIIIKPEGQVISVLGIGANSTKNSLGISKKYDALPLRLNNKKQGALDFQNALCKVVKPFEIGFGY